MTTNQQDQGVSGRCLTARSGALRAEPASPSQAEPPATIAAIILVRADDPEKKPVLYACPTCGAVHSPRIYACRDDLAHATAKAAAEDCYTCRTHNTCSYCGVDCPKGWTACDACRFARKLEAATEIPDDGGPYCDFGGDTFFSEMEEATDAGLEWVAPCNVSYPRIDSDSVLENLLDDMHEDASVDDLVATEAFEAAVKAFNEAQTQQSWFPDEKRKIRVPAQVGTHPQGGDVVAAPFMGDAVLTEGKDAP